MRIQTLKAKTLVEVYIIPKVMLCTEKCAKSQKQFCKIRFKTYVYYIFNSVKKRNLLTLLFCWWFAAHTTESNNGSILLFFFRWELLLVILLAVIDNLMIWKVIVAWTAALARLPSVQCKPAPTGPGLGVTRLKGYH